MANISVTRGLVPEWTQGQPPLTMEVLLKTSGETVPLFLGSPVLYNAGYAVASGATGALTGAIQSIKDANGCPALNWPINTGGSAEITFDQQQVYYIVCDDAIDTTAAAVLAKIGAYNYNTNTETATAATSTTLGSKKSAITLDIASAAVVATPKQLTLIGLTSDRYAQDGTATGAVAKVQISAGKYQS